MRAAASSLLLLAFCLLPSSALANSMDEFSIIGGGQDIEFALPASTTVPDSLFGPTFSFPPVPGTVNGVPGTVSTGFILPGPCAVCDTLQLTTILDGSYNTLFIDLPDLYSVTFPGPNQVDFSFLPGSYTAGTEYPRGGPTYVIDITPQATATTPEPPSLALVATAVLGFLLVLRLRTGFAAKHT